MTKKFATLLAASAVLGVTTAFAANPFSDVTPDTWAYQSVSQLAAAGVINGYPDGTFKGQNNITRYEMAQMVAKAMANQSRANAEQQAMINRLADEFSTELNNLGVRVANLEKKVGNVKVTGDARLRYQGREKEGEFGANTPDKKSKFDFRGRIQFNATVNEDTEAVVRISTGDTEFGDAKKSDVSFDRMFVRHHFGDKLTVDAGRTSLWLGEGFIYNDEPFDGVVAKIGDAKKVQLTAAYGAMTSPYGQSFPSNVRTKLTAMNADANPTVTALNLAGMLGDKTRLSGYYVFGNKYLETDIYGFAVDTRLADKVWLGAEYATTTESDGAWSDSDSWVAGIGYGKYNMSNKGSWDVKLQYFDEGKTSPVFNSRWVQPWKENYKGWLATVDYALMKNVGLAAYYGFNGEDQDGKDKSDFYRADVNIKF